VEQPSSSESESFPSLPPDEAPSNPSGSSAEPDASANVDAAPAAVVTGSGDDLPEWEPLSPELLEDEAIRGDFVLRWAVVGLAILVGCTEIQDARPLVHVRIGEYLVSQGVLPPATDPFSLTAGDRPWVNLSWLFDLASAAAHSLGGAAALSVLQGVLAAATLLCLSQACRPKIRTWWGSLCGALVVLSAYPQWEWRPELITLLGTAVLLWLLVRRETADARGIAWGWIPAGFWLWAQLDSRAWLGWMLLCLYCLGQSLSGRRHATVSSASARPLWTACGASLAVMLIHPFLWETWFAPLRQYLVEYPALRQSYPRPIVDDVAWYPLYADVVWRLLDHRLAAGLLLMASACLSLVLNRARATASYWLWFLGANALAVVTTHELPFAAVVNCVIATVQAQEWYLSRFGQVYSVVWTEVLFSRGGRAVTVVGFFGLAWVIVSGRLDGPDRHRTGVGLSRSLQHELDDFRRLGDVVPDDHAFHFTLRQGDALIAAGRRSYVDHRVALFAGTEEQDLLGLHNQARRMLRQSSSTVTAEERQALTAAAFDQFAVSHLLPRLSTNLAPPDYETLIDLLSSRSWGLAELTSSAGVFVRTDGPDPAARAQAGSRILNVIRRVFRDAELLDVEPRDRAVPPAWSQQWISLPRTAPASGTLLAEHWLRVAQVAQTAPLPFQFSTCLVAVRAAQQGIAETPHRAQAYHVLANAYGQLLQREGAALAGTGIPWAQSLRYYQAISAAQQAARLDPDDPQTQLLLVELWQPAGKADLAYEALDRFLTLTDTLAEPTDEELMQREGLESLRGRLLDVVDANNQGLAAVQSQEIDRLQLAGACAQNECLARAIATLQEDAVYIEQNPLARLQLTAWLAERGDGLDLDDSAAVLSSIGPRLGVPNWRDPIAFAALGRADYQAAVDEWRKTLTDLETNRLTALLITAPMGTASPIFLSDARHPVSHLLAVREAAVRQPESVANVEWQRAMCELERGNLEGAQSGIRRALDRAPSTLLRPLLRLYWFCLTEEFLDAEPPHDWIPIDRETFATEATN